MRIIINNEEATRTRKTQKRQKKGWEIQGKRKKLTSSDVLGPMFDPNIDTVM